MLDMVFADGEVTKKIEGFLDVADKIARTGCLSTGSFTGQIGRLNAYFSMAQRVKDSHKGMMSDFELVWEKFWFRPTEKIVEEWYRPLTELTLRAVEDKIEERGAAFRVNKTSDAGLCFPSCVRGQVLIQEAILTRILAATLEEQTFDWNSWSWLRLAKLKPKLEYYEYNKLKERSRNIWAFNTWSFNFAQLFFRAVLSQYQSFPYDRESRVLVGFNAFYGGLQLLRDTMVDLAQSRASGYSWAVFSDNLYMCVKTVDGMYWLSLDGSMMEATNTPQFIEGFVKACIKHVEGATNDRLCRALKFYMTEVFIKMAGHSLAVLGTTQIPIYGLGSGALATGYINTANMMATTAAVLLDNGPRRVDFSRINSEVQQKRLLDAFEGRGIVVKIEKVTKLGDLPSGSTLALDLLGFDGFVVGEELWLPKGTIFVALQEDRLMRAILYDKASSRHALEMREYNSYKFVKLRALYLMGGGLYEKTAVPLRVALLAYRYRLRDAVPDSVSDEAIAEVLGEASDGMAALIEAAKAYAAKPAIPYIADIVRFNLSKSDYYSWLKRVVEVSRSAEGLVLAKISDLFSDEDYAELVRDFGVDWPRRTMDVDPSFIFKSVDTGGDLVDVDGIQLGAFQLGTQDSRVRRNPMSDQLRGLYSSFARFESLPALEKILAYVRAHAIMGYIGRMKEPIKFFDEDGDPLYRAFKLLGSAGRVPLPAFLWFMENEQFGDLISQFRRNIRLARKPTLETSEEDVAQLLSYIAKQWSNLGRELVREGDWYEPNLWHLGYARENFRGELSDLIKEAEKVV